MKKWTYLLGLCMFFTLFSSCNGEEVCFAPDSMSYANVQNYSLNLDSTQDEIVDVPISPNRRNGISTYSVNENSSFLGIREMEVNIIVRENTHNSNMRYLTSNGVQKELSVRAQDTKSGRQFKIYGRWEGISCADVDYEINVLNSSGQLVKSLKTKGKLNEPLKF